MPEEKIRLGGMALANGVLVHGPNAWACAIRTPGGELKVESAYKGFRAAEVERPFLRGPARLAEVMLLLPQMRRALPEARLPFERPRVLAAMLGSAVAAQVIKTSRLRPLAQELLAGAFSLAPAALAVRGSEVAAYHGAEHISIGSYEHGETRAKEHERCGSHIVGPLLISSAVGGTLAARAPERWRGPARAAAQLGAVCVVMQVFQKHDAYLGGMDEAIAILKLCSEDWDELTVHALYDGDRVEPHESVMTIEGDYTSFAHLETLYLGVLARRTLITTNVARGL